MIRSQKKNKTLQCRLASAEKMSTDLLFKKLTTDKQNDSNSKTFHTNAVHTDKQEAFRTQILTRRKGSLTFFISEES